MFLYTRWKKKKIVILKNHPWHFLTRKKFTWYIFDQTNQIFNFLKIKAASDKSYQKVRVPGSQGAYDKNEELQMELDRSKSACLELVGIQNGCIFTRGDLEIIRL